MRLGVALFGVLILAAPPAHAAPVPAKPKTPAAKAGTPTKPPTKAAPARRPTPAPVAIPDTGVLEHHHLLRIAALGLGKPADAFSASPIAKYVGRDFVLYQTLRQEDDAEYAQTNGRWMYFKDTGSLAFALKNTNEFDLHYEERTIGRFTAQNAFGARWPAVHREMRQLAIRTSLNQADPFHMNAGPDEARALTAAVRLKIEGHLSAGPGELLDCDHDTDAATIDDPVQWDRMECSLAGELTRVTLIDRRTGAVLKEWTF